MTFFFDRSVGKRIPEALRSLRGFPFPVEYHQLWFDSDEDDDIWLPRVGDWGWTVIGHDWSYHQKTAELAALKQYNIGCFYLWGSEAPDWQVLQCFARAYDRIETAIKTTSRPFIFKIGITGRLHSITIP